MVAFSDAEWWKLRAHLSISSKVEANLNQGPFLIFLCWQCFSFNIYWEMSTWTWKLVLYCIEFIKFCFGSVSERLFIVCFKGFTLQKSPKPVSISYHEYLLLIKVFHTKVHVWWTNQQTRAWLAIGSGKYPLSFPFAFFCFCLLCLEIYIVGKILEHAMGLGLHFPRPLVCKEVGGIHRWLFPMSHRGRGNMFGEKFLKAILCQNYASCSHDTHLNNARLKNAVFLHLGIAIIIWLKHLHAL